MKKILLSTAATILLATSAMATIQNQTGCGLGSQLIKDDSSAIMLSLQATSNGTSGNQTFGITFGTLGCDGNGPVTSSAKLALFIDGNMDNLARDISQGQGETLSTLAEVWGVEKQDQATFNEVAQANFSKVFTSENVTSQAVLENLNNLMSANKQLATYTL